MLSRNRSRYLIQVLQESLGKFGDDEGRQWRVKDVIAHAEANKDKYYHDKVPTHKLGHDLSWWDKQHATNPKKSTARMHKANTKYPLIVLKDKGQLSVADGLNRLKKATSVEGKSHVPAYIIPKEHIQHLAIKKKGGQ